MFHARDERTVQSFPLDEDIYAKYVKVSVIYFIIVTLPLHLSLLSAKVVLTQFNLLAFDI